MTKRSPHLISTILRALISLLLLRFCSPKNVLDNLDLSTQTLMPTATGFKITGNTGNNYLGGSVSTVGDINNDGYDDIIVGAHYKNNYQGAAYVIYGGPKSSISDWDFSSGAILNPSTTGFMITGGVVGDWLGHSVNTAGDINNDGYDDIIVGAPYKNSRQGAAYVIYGGPKSSMINWDFSSGQTLTPSTTGFMITGIATLDYFGRSVSTAGDINKDGYDDIIIGADGTNSRQGTVYVIYGGEKSAMSHIALSSTTLIPASTGFTITGNAASNNFGYSLSRAGDINKDGYDDIIVGAPNAQSPKGVTYVIYGRDKSVMTDILLSTQTLDPLTTGFTITGISGDYLGNSVSTAGDINKDGYDDIIIGARMKNSYKGAAYVIYGGASMINWDFSSGQTLTPSTTGFMVTGNAINDNFGYSVSTAGDVNKDGYDDIIIGAYQVNGYRGAAYIIYGGEKASMSNILLSTHALDPLTTGITITGNAANDNFGYSVSTAGDVNKDGYDDIIVGAYNKNGAEGAAYVIYASCSKNCKQCSSESVCTDCKSPYFLYQSECFASCPEATTPISSSTCGDCPAHCKQCLSTSICTQCQNSYILYLSQCLDVCPDGRFLSTTTSTCEACISPCSKCTSLTACTECISPLILYTSGCLPSCPISMFRSDGGVCKYCSSHCGTCTSQDSCQVCIDGYTLSNSNSLCVLTGAQEKALKAVSSATQGIGSVVCVGSAVFPLSALVSKIVQNTRYLNLSVTSELAQVYQTWQTDLIPWDVPNLMSDLDHFETSPTLFSQYDLDSPFLVNFWPTLINVGIGFGTFIACILIQKIFEHEKYEGWAYSLVLKLVSGSFNFALIQAYACLDDILFYLVLDAKTNPFNSFFSWTSMICAVLFLALGCLQVLFNFWTVYKYQGIKNQGTKELMEAFNHRNKYWELFYSDFNDDDLWSQAFFAIAIIRSALSSFTIVVLYEYPLMQAVYFVIMDVAIISFLYFKSPFKTLRGKLAQYYYEIITLLVHLCAFILALQDSFEKSSATVRLIMSTGILYLNTALISGAIGFMFIEIYETLRLKDKAKKLKQRQSVPEDSQEIQNLSQKVPSESFVVQKRQHFFKREQTPSFENFHLEPENDQIRDKNAESSQGLESNSYVENSMIAEMIPSHQMNRQRNRSPALIIQHRPQNPTLIQPRNNPRYPNYVINYEE